VLALPDMLDLLVDEFASLGGRRLALSFVFPGSLKCLLFRHKILLQQSLSKYGSTIVRL
jgi:hypothetical protein